MVVVASCTSNTCSVQWRNYFGGIFDGCNQTTPSINHAVQLVGYGTDNGKDYWLVR